MIPENDKRVIAMRKLGYSDAQIEEMLEDDKAVDRGESLPWDMSKDEHKKAVKYANADEHKKTTKKPIKFDDSPRPKAKNASKIEIMDAIFAFLSEKCDFEFENLEIVEFPTQKKIEIVYKGESFTLALTGHHKK